MLGGGAVFGPNAEELIDASQLAIAITQRGESGLYANFTVIGSNGLFADSDVEIDRLNRQEFQERIPSRGGSGDQRKRPRDK